MEASLSLLGLTRARAIKWPSRLLSRCDSQVAKGGPATDCAESEASGIHLPEGTDSYMSKYLCAAPQGLPTGFIASCYPTGKATPDEGAQTVACLVTNAVFRKIIGPQGGWMDGTPP